MEPEPGDIVLVACKVQAIVIDEGGTFVKCAPLSNADGWHTFKANRSDIKEVISGGDKPKRDEA